MPEIYTSTELHTINELVEGYKTKEYLPHQRAGGFIYRQSGWS